MSENKVSQKLTRASRLIMRKGEVDVGLELLATLPEDARRTSEVRLLRLMGFGLLGRAAPFDAMLVRLLEQPELVPKLRESCFWLLRRKSLPVTEASYALLWGPRTDDLQVAIDGLQPADMGNVDLSDLVGTIETARGSLIDGSTYTDRFRLGIQRGFYCKYLTQGRKSQKKKTGIDVSSLLDQLDAIERKPDTSALTDLLKRGQSVVVLQSHGPARRAAQNALNDVTFPKSLLGKSMRKDPAPGDFHITITADDMPIRFAKLCQLMRKGPRVVEILPDGLVGQQVLATLAGRTVQVGVGAAPLAYYGKATFVFAISRWVGHEIETVFTIGPKVDTSDTMDSTQDKMVAFYIECMTKALLDDPINFPSTTWLPDLMGTRKS